MSRVPDPDVEVDAKACDSAHRHLSSKLGISFGIHVGVSTPSTMAEPFGWPTADSKSGRWRRQVFDATQAVVARVINDVHACAPPRGSEGVREPWGIEVQRLDGRWTEDDVPDDLSVVLASLKGLVVISGCGHAGVVNVVEAAKERVRVAPVVARQFTVRGGDGVQLRSRAPRSRP